jgi:DNA polymerase V
MSSEKGMTMNKRKPLFQDVQILIMPVHAGFPSLADDYKEPPLSLNDLVIYHPVATYFARVSGDSMIGACIYPNDVVVVDRALTAANNRIVVARVGEELTIKRLQVIGRKTFLKPENPSYTSIEVKQGEDFEIWGVVTWVVHQLVHYKQSGNKG